MLLSNLYYLRQILCIAAQISFLDLFVICGFGYVLVDMNTFTEDKMPWVQCFSANLNRCNRVQLVVVLLLCCLTSDTADATEDTVLGKR